MEPLEHVAKPVVEPTPFAPRHLPQPPFKVTDHVLAQQADVVLDAEPLLAGLLLLQDPLRVVLHELWCSVSTTDEM